MPGTEYTVRLEAFEGPMDLLLFLVRRAEVEITDIPIAEITEQYLGYLKQLGADRRGGRLDIEQAGEFLVMAATLMEIKSRMLSPRPAVTAGADGVAESRPGEPVDPRAELVRQLLEYKRFRDATDQLEDYRREWDHRFPAARVPLSEPLLEPAATAPDDKVDIDDLQLVDLLQAFARVVENVDFSRVGEHHVKLDETPIEVHGERLVERLRAAACHDAAEGADGVHGGVRFTSLFVSRTRSEMIGIFLALLEMVKQQRVVVRQDAIHGEIMLMLTPETSVAAAPDVVVSASSVEAPVSA